MSVRLGLDIGLREMRIAEADGGRLTGHTEILLPEGAIEDGMPTPLLTVAIRGAMQAAGLKACGYFGSCALARSPAPMLPCPCSPWAPSTWL